MDNIAYVEPYAGSAAVALALLFEEYASVIYINDLDRAIFALWHTILQPFAAYSCISTITRRPEVVA
jgi:DNA adenine methylase